MEQVTKMTCDWCGSEFPADPRACVESGIGAFYSPEEGDEWKGEHRALGHELNEEDRKEAMKEMNLSEEELNELLKSGSVTTGGSIVCLKCQDDALAESLEE